MRITELSMIGGAVCLVYIAAVRCKKAEKNRATANVENNGSDLFFFIEPDDGCIAPMKFDTSKYDLGL